MKKKRKAGRWVVLAILVIALGAALILIYQSRNTSIQYTEEIVHTGTLETYYTFSGNVAVKDSQSIAAKSNGTVRDIYVEENDLVTKDTALMRLSSGDIIKADISGEVTDIHVSQGDSVSVGAALLEIVNFDDLQVLVKVDEYDVAAVSVGKEATITIDALGLTYSGVVEHLSKQAMSATTDPTTSMASGSSSGGNVTYYEAKLTAPEDERVLPGMQVEVKLLNAKAENATLLSMAALQFDDYNKPYVYIRDTSGKVVTQNVTVGVQDGATVEIVDGLRAGETVLIPPQNSMDLMSMWQG